MSSMSSRLSSSSIVLSLPGSSSISDSSFADSELSLSSSFISSSSSNTFEAFEKIKSSSDLSSLSSSSSSSLISASSSGISSLISAAPIASKSKPTTASSRSVFSVVAVAEANLRPPNHAYLTASRTSFGAAPRPMSPDPRGDDKMFVQTSASPRSGLESFSSVPKKSLATPLRSAMALQIFSSSSSSSVSGLSSISSADPQLRRCR
mmetsp:Transcript_5609/g.13363  ORF Transcript_5609/g.13363 Transcript_5609/m.13363 type:complete len:207 (-) Transcript_5609:2442-3062(-)